MSFFDSGGTGNRPYVDIGIDPELTTSNTISMLLMNRETSTGGNAPQLDVELTRTGQTGTFGGKTGNGYRYTLNATQAAALGTAGWLFKDDTIIVDFVSNILRSESVINFNPDEIQFTSGTGYAAPSVEHAAQARAIGARLFHAVQITSLSNVDANLSVGAPPSRANAPIIFEYTVTDDVSPSATVGAMSIINLSISLGINGTDVRGHFDIAIFHERGPAANPTHTDELARSSRYIRARSGIELATFDMSAFAQDLRMGDVIRLRNFSFVEGGERRISLETGADFTREFRFVSFL